MSCYGQKEQKERYMLPHKRKYQLTTTHAGMGCSLAWIMRCVKVHHVQQRVILEHIESHALGTLHTIRCTRVESIRTTQSQYLTPHHLKRRWYTPIHITFEANLMVKVLTNESKTCVIYCHSLEGVVQIYTSDTWLAKVVKLRQSLT
jgi:hypothetical protein